MDVNIKQKYENEASINIEKYNKIITHYNNVTNKRNSSPNHTYIAYAATRIKELQIMYPNKSLVDITLIVGKEWEEMTNEQKQPYYDMIKILSKIF